MVKLPKIKKDVNAFLVGEEGKISKQSLMKTGAMLTLVAATAEDVAAHGSHTNSMSLGWSSFESQGSHADHYSHASHGSHGSCGWVSW
tara:strand:+ start:213 stop:476 length:264 start_codon:yes stop_codon:yes gene_type:complete